MAPRPVLLLDDRCLLDVLLAAPSSELRRLIGRRPTYTTGLWYYRLLHAATSDSTSGALSGPLERASSETKAAAMNALLALPDEIGLVSLRDLAPTMARLIRNQRLNALSLEALAAASYLPAELVLAETSLNPSLQAAAADLKIRVLIVPVG